MSFAVNLLSNSRPSRPAYGSPAYWGLYASGAITEAEAKADAAHAEAVKQRAQAARDHAADRRGIFATFPTMGFKTFAKDPVWNGSHRAGVRFQPITKRERWRIWNEAQRMEQARARACRTGGGRNGGSVEARRGVLGAAALKVLYALLFEFLNMRTGQLDPSYEGLALKTGLSRSSVYRALHVLKAAGLLHWQRRCTAFVNEAGRFCVEQFRNAYAVLAPASWVGHEPKAEPPAPEPDTWGAASTRGGIVEEALQGIDRRDTAALVRALEADSGDPIAAALARMGRGLARKSMKPA